MMPSRLPKQVTITVEYEDSRTWTLNCTPTDDTDAMEMSIDTNTRTKRGDVMWRTEPTGTHDVRLTMNAVRIGDES